MTVFFAIVRAKIEPCEIRLPNLKEATVIGCFSNGVNMPAYPYGSACRRHTPFISFFQTSLCKRRPSVECIIFKPFCVCVMTISYRNESV